MTTTMSFLAFIFLYGIKVVFVIAVIGFIISLWKKDNGIADIIYGFHFMALVLLAALLSSALASYFDIFPSISYFLTAMVLLWGLRLSVSIYKKHKGKPEDFRYAAWRANWKWFKTRSFLQIYLLQGVIALIIAAPIVLTIMLTPSRISLLIILGVLIWMKGFFYELIGDAQLARFMKVPENKGKLMTSGLWRYTRHPNYFGEALMWWGLWVVSLTGAADIWYLTILSPLLITVLLVKVSGVPMLEARMSQHPDWAEYARKTNALIPWFPKK